MKDCVYSIFRFLKSHQYTFTFHPRPRTQIFYWTASLAEYMRKEQPSLIFSYLLPSVTVCLLARRFSSCNVPLISSFRSTLDPLGYIGERRKIIQMKYLKHLLPDTEKIHAVSRGVADSIVIIYLQLEIKWYRYSIQYVITLPHSLHNHQPPVAVFRIEK